MKKTSAFPSLRRFQNLLREWRKEWFGPGLRPWRWRRLELETLESRIAPTTSANWTGGGDGTSWFDAHNWDILAVPGPNNDVNLNLNQPNIKVQFAGGQQTVTVNSIQVTNDALDIISGTLTVAQGVSVSKTLTMDGGSLNTGAGLNVAGTLTVNGGAISGSTTLTNAALNFSANSTGTVNATIFGTGSALSGSVPQTTTLTLETNFGFNTTVAIADGTINNGTIFLDSTRGDRASELSITGTFTNSGTVEAEDTANQGGSRFIVGNMINSGILTVDPTIGATYQSGTLTDNGIINANGSLAVNSATWDFSGGLVSVPGSLSANSTTINWSGGATSGTVTLVNSTLNGSAIATTGASFEMFGTSSALSGSLPKNTTLTLETSFPFNTTVAVADGTTNKGSILLDSTRGDRTSQLVISGTMTNNGTLEMQNAEGQVGGRTITGNLTNTGTFQVDAGVNATYQNGTFNDSGNITANGGLFINSSTWNISGGTATVGNGSFIQASSSTVNFSGGATSGSITLVDCTLNSTAPSTTGASFTFFDNGNTLEGTLPKNTTVTLETSASFQSTVTVATGTVNNGVILLDSTRGDRTSEIVVTGTFTNNGTIEAEAVSNQGGGRVINGNLTNHGTLTVDSNIGLTYQNGTLVDDGVINANSTGNNTLAVNNSTWNLSGSTVNVPGSLTTNSSIVNWSGGATSGVVTMVQSTLNGSAPSTTGASFTMLGTNSALSGDLPKNTTLTLETNFSLNTTVAVADGTTNNGTMLLDSTRGDRTSQLVISGTMTNNGTLEMQNAEGQGGGRTITGNLNNTGTLQVDSGVNATYQNGTLNDSG